MNKILISVILITSIIECGLALDIENSVEMRPAEAAMEQLFSQGIGEPWVGGNPPGWNDQEFSQFYSINKVSSSQKHIEPPKKHEISAIPTTVYYSHNMQPVPYNQYQTYSTYTGGNSLWIQGATSWTQYAQVPQGSSLSLLAINANGGNGYLYEILPSGMLNKNNFQFFPGTNQIEFFADTIGQHILLYTIGDQVSNSIVIDVISYAPIYQYPSQTPTIQPYTQGTILPTPSIPIPTTGDSTAIIKSQRMRGYQVYLDGKYIGTEGTGGDSLDGTFIFKVVGNQDHAVRVFDGQFNYPKTMFFDRGGTKIINVEPGTAV